MLNNPNRCHSTTTTTITNRLLRHLPAAASRRVGSGFEQPQREAARTPKPPLNAAETVSGYYGRLPWQPQVSARASISHSMKARERRRG